MLQLTLDELEDKWPTLMSGDIFLLSNQKVAVKNYDLVKKTFNKDNNVNVVAGDIMYTTGCQTYIYYMPMWESLDMVDIPVFIRKHRAIPIGNNNKSIVDSLIQQGTRIETLPEAIFKIECQ